MRSVNVKTDKLLEKVIANKMKHVQEYREAIANYKAVAIREVNKAFEKLKRQITELESGEVMKLAAIKFDLPVPENHEKDYDQVIEMLKMCVDDELSIQSDEFACYVMDDWDWQENFKMLNQTYVGMRNA